MPEHEAIDRNKIIDATERKLRKLAGVGPKEPLSVDEWTYVIHEADQEIECLTGQEPGPQPM